MHETLELAFLGTGGSWPTVDRNVPAVALRWGSEVLLFDCGEGTQRQFQRTTFSYMAVSRIFITHLHADHFLGVPGLVQTMRFQDRRKPLSIHGPAGVREVLGPLLAIGRSRGKFKIDIHEHRHGDVIRGAGFRVEAKSVHHTTETLGWAFVEDDRLPRFHKEKALALGVPEGPLFGRLQRGHPVETPDGRIVRPEEVLGPPRRGRKVAYTGDCVPCEGGVELGRNSDVFIHDSTYGSDFAEAVEYGHSTAAQAAFIAKKAGARKLYLFHISPRYPDASALLEEARKIFPETYESRDFLEVVVRVPPDEEAEIRPP